MAVAIMAEVWDEKMRKWKALVSFNSFDAFYAYTKEFKIAEWDRRLRVHIPGSFVLTVEQRALIDSLSIERF